MRRWAVLGAVVFSFACKTAFPPCPDCDPPLPPNTVTVTKLVKCHPRPVEPANISLAAALIPGSAVNTLLMLGNHDTAEREREIRELRAALKECTEEP